MKKFHPLADCLPMLAESEMIELADDIKKNGLNHPVMLFEGMILDGRNRYVACQRAGIPARFVEFDGDFEGATALVISENIVRRQLTPTQKATSAAELERVIGDRLRSDAREKQVSTLKHGSENPNPVCQIIDTRENEPKFERNETRTTARLAEMTGANRQYVSDAIVIRDTEPELFQQMKSGEKTIPQVKREIKKKEVIESLESVEAKEAKAVEGVFDVVVIDPPWPMKKINMDCRPNQVEFDYPTMTVEEISEMTPPFADDCHIWLWTTHKYLPHAFDILKSWGVKYVCCFTWHKSNGFQPFGLPKYNCEFALYARKGSPVFIDAKAFNVCFDAKQGSHSVKPEEFYDVVRRVTAGRRLDMFNRRKIEGFEVWGKES